MAKYAKIRENCSPSKQFWIDISKENLLEVVSDLKSDFCDLMLISITCVDNLPSVERFSIIYNFLSLKENYRIFLRVYIKDRDTIGSICGIFNNSIWYEREIWDMCGILFEGNTDMRRILTDYGFVGHPMRKDFPLTGYTEVCYDQEVMYKKVDLEQDFRIFDSGNNWSALPGDEKIKLNK